MAMFALGMRPFLRAYVLLIVVRSDSLDVNALLQITRHTEVAPKLPSVHFVYTTGCDDYQLTHSVVLDHSWRAVGNVGRLTRIVANCGNATEQEKDLLRRSPLQGDSDFSVFFAQGVLDAIPGTSEVYPARSRPHALTQWLKASPPSEPVLALLDPDFLFLRPLSAHPGLQNVRRHQMLTPDGWFGPVKRKYQTGPVWLMTLKDFRDILPLWRNKSDEKAGQDNKELMREQYAFQEAAEELHVPAVFDGLLSSATPGFLENMYSLHYYASYNYEEWKFHKALATSGWYADHFNNSVPPPLACEAPLLEEPPQVKEGKVEQLMLSALLPGMNKAFRAYREIYCPGEKDIFAARGLAAFGLARTVHPMVCPSHHAGSITRYRVEVSSEPPAWNVARPLGGNICSPEAQAPERAK
eukprot:TRINITY_DN54617_c0_g1_i1.p1 TRINITY_DN54617_c0_g1~~TRINITY_DN54617_c0_g1_i1.p1  ORF type:complete len:412 (+),score=65.63 TRINITY_DN54617_c0_g1_i1:78-1313(+)